MDRVRCCSRITAPGSEPGLLKLARGLDFSKTTVIKSSIKIAAPFAPGAQPTEVLTSYHWLQADPGANGDPMGNAPYDTNASTWQTRANYGLPSGAGINLIVGTAPLHKTTDAGAKQVQVAMGQADTPRSGVWVAREGAVSIDLGQGIYLTVVGWDAGAQPMPYEQLTQIATTVRVVSNPEDRTAWFTASSAVFPGAASSSDS